MSGPALDTSGSVFNLQGHLSVREITPPGRLQWDDLSPFAQGYVEALFAERFPGGLERMSDALGFSDLAPEALAMILREDDDLQDVYSNTTQGGAMFWADRQSGGFLGLNPQTRFPPLRVNLDDDGKVALSQASGEAA